MYSGGEGEGATVFCLCVREFAALNLTLGNNEIKYKDSSYRSQSLLEALT